MRLQSDRRRLALDGFAIAVAAAALWVALGPLGLGVAVAVAVVLVSVSPVYAYAVGQLGFVILATTVHGDVPVAGVGAAQVGLGAVLAATLLDRWPFRTAALAVGVLVVSAVGLGAAAAVEPLWHGAAILAGLYAVLAYTLHRYELVRLGLVGEVDG